MPDIEIKYKREKESEILFLFHPATIGFTTFVINMYIMSLYYHPTISGESLLFCIPIWAINLSIFTVMFTIAHLKKNERTTYTKISKTNFGVTVGVSSFFCIVVIALNLP